MMGKDQITVVILGSGTCVPTGKRGPSSTALIAPDGIVLVDAGSGALEKLARCGFSWEKVRAIFLTHFHVDHTSDLSLFLFAANYAPGKRRREPLELIGPEGLGDFVRRLVSLYRWVEPREYDLLLREGARPEGKVGEFLSFRTCPALHGDGRALSVRFDSPWGSVTISGDTGENDELVALAEGSDLLVIEASFPDDSTAGDGHLSPAAAGRIARKAGVKKVVLTHLYPETASRDPKSACAAQVEVPVIVAHDLLRLTLSATSNI
ncbi:MAG: MBL fold metallo-hydrolase [Deltaproteobacteria bacterium]|nr:MAG: MBL fold metallo-hydrolase [Deltaproteobacteria bacterium]